MIKSSICVCDDVELLFGFELTAWLIDEFGDPFDERDLNDKVL